MKHKSLPTGIILSTILVLLSLHLVSSENVEVKVQDPADLASPEHMFLSPSSPFTRSLDKDQADYYEVFILPKDDKLTITKEASSGDVELFISLDPNNEYPNEKLFTYTSKATNRNWIELSQSDLAKACMTQSPVLCVIYVTVIPQETPASYSISVRRSVKKTSRPSYSITQLEDDRNLSLPIPSEKSLPEIFYFYTLPFKPSLISTNASGWNVTIYASFMDRNTDISNLANVNIPSNSSYNFTSQGNLSIPALRIEAPMLTMLTLYFEKNDRFYGSRDPNYSIRLISEMMPISFRTQYNSIAPSKQYRYMTLDLQCARCNILISVKSLDGQNITVVVDPLYQDELPTIENSKFIERQIYGSKFLLVSDNDLSEMLHPTLKYKDSHYFSGTWVVGVYAENSTEFSLWTNHLNEQLIELEPNKTVKVNTGFARKSYFLYKPETKMPINIRVRNLPTSARYYIRQISKQEDFILNLPNSANYQWLTPASIDRSACDDCLYIIAIEDTNTQFEIEISERGNQLIDTTNGNLVTNCLLSDDSNIITLPHYAYQDIYIAINSTAEKLELYTSNDSSINTANYLWNTELAFDNETKVLKIPRIETTYDASKAPNCSGCEGNYMVNLYIEIKNPTSQMVNYTLVMLALKEENPEKQLYTSDVSVSQGLLFYASTEIDVIQVSVNFTSYSGYYLANQEVKAYYWSDYISGVPATSVHMSKINIFEKTINEVTQIKQLFRTNSKKGKFFFMIKNYYPAAMDVSTQISVPFIEQYETLDNDSYSQFTLIPGQNQTYQIEFNGPGVLYLYAYSCKKATTEITVQNRREEDYNITNLQSDWVHFNKTLIGEGQLIQVITIPALQTETQNFALKPTFLTGSRALYSYELSTRYPSQTRIKAEDRGGKISAEIDPAIIQNYNISEDTIFYEIVACPNSSPNNGYPYQRTVTDQDLTRCPDENCFSQRGEEVYIYKQKTAIKLELEVTRTGTYTVMIFAHIKSQGQELRFWIIGSKIVKISYIQSKLEPVIYPQPAQSELPVVREEPFKSTEAASEKSWGSIAMVTLIVIAIVLAGFIGYKYLKRSGAGSTVDAESWNDASEGESINS